MPVTLIGEAVFARCLSAIKNERVAASKLLAGPAVTKFDGDKKQFIEDIRQVMGQGRVAFGPCHTVTVPRTQALYASKIISYAQGFMLLREAAKEAGWNLNYAGIALMWRGGCIIRRWDERVHEWTLPHARD